MRPALRTGYMLALTLWVGGLATLVLVVAPTTFGTAPDRSIAGTIFGAVLRSFSRIELACGVVALVCAGSLVGRPWGKTDIARGALVILMLALSAIVAFWLLPTMDSLRFTEPERFQSLHRVSTGLYGTNLLLGAAAVALGPPGRAASS